MKVTAEPLPESQVLLQIELEGPEIELHKERAYRRLVQRYMVPGFRKGKAPRNILERYLGAEVLLQEDLEGLLERSALEAIRQQSLEAIARPEIGELHSLDPMAFKATVSLRPKVELGDYASLRVPWEPPQVTPAQVQEALEAIRRQTTPWEPAGRPVQMGDLLTLDVRGALEGAAAPAEGEEARPAEAAEQVFMDQKGFNYLLQEDETYPMPGFAAQLVGMEVGQTKEFLLEAPADFTVRDLAGKSCRFAVAFTEIKEQRPSALDDEWAKGVLGGFESLEALQAKVRTDLEQQAEAYGRLAYEEKALEALAAQATVEFPPVLVETEIDRLFQDEDERLSSMGLTLAEQIARTGRDPAAYREEARPQARQRVARSLLVSRLAETEGVSVSPEEVEGEVERLLAAQPEGEARANARQIFSTEAGQEALRRRLLARKALDSLTAIARGERGAGALVS